MFAVAVIVYVVYGGFRAVVWTDVMQGIVMFIGVILMLGLTLHQVGGLENATRQMAKMTPPEFGQGVLRLKPNATEGVTVKKGVWIDDREDVLRVAESTEIPFAKKQSDPVRILRLTTESERERVRESIAKGLVPSLDLQVDVKTWDRYEFGADQPGVYLSNPGPHDSNSIGFLAIGSAISFMIFWPFASAGQPSNLVRLLSFKDTKTLRYSVVTVSIYYAVIYLALVIVFCCAASAYAWHGDRSRSDNAGPCNSVDTQCGYALVSRHLGRGAFAAVMSSVDSFLLVVSSAVVRDFYQGFVRKDADEKRIKRLSYFVTIVVGVLAMLFVIDPPKYLQDLIVFATGGLAACFLVPLTLSLYWQDDVGRCYFWDVWRDIDSRRTHRLGLLATG